MEYRIILERMEFRALHGCYELERKVGNRFTVDLELTAELGDVAAEDSVELAINYLTVYCATKYFVEGLSIGLRREVSGYNIRVTNLQPGVSILRFIADV